jgi:hypothetical protein
MLKEHKNIQTILLKVIKMFALFLFVKRQCASSLILIKLSAKSFMQNYLLNKRKNRENMVFQAAEGMSLQKDHGLQCCTI